LESAKWCKDNGFLVKVDTNGSNPGLVKEMVEDKLVDFIALDYKYPDLPNEYLKFHTNSMLRWNFEETLSYLINEANIPFETRTTIHPDITDENKANVILKELERFGYKGTHYFQFFNQCPETFGNVNQNPRRFDISKLEIPKSFKVEYRNSSANDRRI
jgi:pyruvate formate lyase activating enzyme